MAESNVVAGIFVGGRSRRLGGQAKGLLPTAEGETVLARVRKACEAVSARILLVGPPALREPYADTGLSGIDDDPRAEGPLAGLVALLANATEGRAIALAVDMPFIREDLLRRLIDDPANAPIVAGRRGETWQPYFARYDAARVLPIALAAARNGKLSLQSLLDDAGAHALELSAEDAAALADWDKPSELPSALPPK